MENINCKINFDVKNDNKIVAAVAKIEAGVVDVQQAVVKVDNVFSKTFNNISSQIKTIGFGSMLQQINIVAHGLNSITAPGLNLSTSLYDLQAITGVTGSKLQEIEGYARQAAKTFGGSAADGVESYKLILSQLAPEIAQTPSALKAMGDSVNTLSKTMGGDTVAATEVLTTAMNQYQVSTDDPIAASKEMANMMNVMAAGRRHLHPTTSDATNMTSVSIGAWTYSCIDNIVTVAGSITFSVTTGGSTATSVELTLPYVPAGSATINGAGATNTGNAVQVLGGAGNVKAKLWYAAYNTGGAAITATFQYEVS